MVVLIKRWTSRLMEWLNLRSHQRSFWIIQRRKKLIWKLKRSLNMELLLNQVSSMLLFRRTSERNASTTEENGNQTVAIVSKALKKWCTAKKVTIIIQLNNHQESLLNSQRAQIHLDKTQVQKEKQWIAKPWLQSLRVLTQPQEPLKPQVITQSKRCMMIAALATFQILKQGLSSLCCV